MLKIAVYDSGYGGELFADKLEEDLAVVKVIRVIDWRNADTILSNKKVARQIAEEDLKPYIGKVDLIVFANHLLSITSLEYFRKKYKKQNFVGFDLVHPATFLDRQALILTTSAVAKTHSFREFVSHLKRQTKTIALDDWPAKIDDGELDIAEIVSVKLNLQAEKFYPKEIILACSQFSDIKPDLRQVFGYNTKIYDSFTEAFYNVCRALGIRSYHKYQ